MVALLLAIAGDGIALTAPSAGLFLIGRALVGIGVGAVLALTFAAVRFVSRPEQLGQALGVWNLLIIAGFIGGSLLGGVLADSSWRLALGLVPVIALVCLPLIPLLLPEMPANRSLRAGSESHGCHFRTNSFTSCREIALTSLLVVYWCVVGY